MKRKALSEKQSASRYQLVPGLVWLTRLVFHLGPPIDGIDRVHRARLLEGWDWLKVEGTEI